MPHSRRLARESKKSFVRLLSMGVYDTTLPRGIRIATISLEGAMESSRIIGQRWRPVMPSSIVVGLSVSNEEQTNSGDQTELICVAFIPSGSGSVYGENSVVGVQRDGVWSGANCNSVSLVEVVDDLVPLSGGYDLNQPETGNTVDKRSREPC